jgi:hypothetical protein
MMNGHWLGRYQGSNAGRVLIEIDDVGDHYEGQAFLYGGNPTLPYTFTRIITKDKSWRFEDRVSVYPIHPQTGDPTKSGGCFKMAQPFPERRK